MYIIPLVWGQWFHSPICQMEDMVAASFSERVRCTVLHREERATAAWPISIARAGDGAFLRCMARGKEKDVNRGSV